MKINNQFNQNFGYNLDYHKKVQKTLESKKRENVQIARYLSEADKLSLKIEDEVVQLDKTGKNKSQSYGNLCDFLVDLKDSLAFNIELICPNLKYGKALYNQYEKEIKENPKNACNWRTNIINRMKQYIVVPHPVINISEQVENQDKYRNEEEIDPNASIREYQEQAVDDYISKKAKEFISKYQKSPEQKGFRQVVGMDDIKLRLQEEIIDYALDPSKVQADLEEYGISLPRGFLLFGPPGCGKTFITEALAQESGLDLYKMDISKIGSKYVNETAGNIEKAFEYLRLAAIKNNAPVLLFMDEVDSLAINRQGSSSGSHENDKTTTTLLKHVQEARDKNIIIIAATNKFDLLDKAFQARFDSQIYVGLPDEAQIKALVKSELQKRLKGKNLSEDNEAVEIISKELKGFSNRSIVFILDDAAKKAKRNGREEITLDTVMGSIKNTELEKVNEREYIKDSKRNAIGFKGISE